MSATTEQLKWAFEVDRCAKDFEYLCNTYLHIKSKTVIGFPTLKLNRPQMFLWQKIQDQWKREGYVRQCWGKSRQVGASTLVHALNFWRTNFHDYHNSFIIDHDEPSSYEQFDKIKTFYDALPDPLKSVTRYWAKGKIDFEDRRSRILCGHARNANVGAGDMNHFLHMTEAARYPNADHIQTSIFPSISEAKGADPSFIIIESTSFFGGDWFKNFAEDAMAGRNGFEFHFVPYYLHDEYQRPLPHDFRMTEEEKQLLRSYPLMTPENICWRRHKRGEYANNPVLFEQEYPISWEQSWILPSGTSMTFDGDRLDQLSSGIYPGRRAFVSEKGLDFSIGGHLEVWEDPVDGCYYDIGIDIAEGRTEAADWTVLEVIRRDTLEQVAEARGHWDPAGEEFLNLCYWTGMIYNRGQVIPDITGGWGHALLSDLQRRDYPNLWQWRRRDDAKERVSNRVGFLYTHRDKALLVNNAVRVVTREEPKLHSHLLVDEMRHFLTIGLDEWGASPGYKDDCLRKGTLVKTALGYKEIEKIQIGDFVLTHRGRYRRVWKTIKKPLNGACYEVKALNQLPIIVSYNHPLFTTRRSRKKDGSNEWLRRTWQQPGKLRRDDRLISVVGPLDTPTVIRIDESQFFKCDKRATNIRLRSLVVDREFGWFLGRFLADGCAHKHTGKHRTWTVSIAFSVDEVFDIEKVQGFLKGLGITSHVDYRKGTNGCAVIFGSRLLWTVLRQAYNEHREKIIPEFAWSLGTDLVAVLDGWLSGDGWVDEERKCIIGATTSRRLALDMRDIAFSSGRYAGIAPRRCSRYGVPTKDQFWVTVYDTAPQLPRSRPLSGYEYASSISAIKTFDVDEEVYNLEVEEDESFVAEGVVVHNCVNAWALALMGAIDEGRRGAPVMKLPPKEYKERCYYHNIDADLTPDTALSGDFVARFSKP